MAAQHSKEGDYSTRYRFNGKEQDEATGFYYYGARYYEPSLSRWLSVDPLAEKYQGFSPYNYTLNNPIMFVDPDGRAVGDPPAKQIDLEGVTVVGHRGTSSLAREYSETMPVTWTTSFKGNLSDYNNTYGTSYTNSLEAGEDYFEKQSYAMLIQQEKIFADGIKTITNGFARDYIEPGAEIVLFEIASAMIATEIALSKIGIEAGNRVFWSGGDIAKNAAGVSLRSTWRTVEYNILKNQNIIYKIVK